MSRNTRHHLPFATFPVIVALYGQHYRTLAPDDAGGGAGGGKTNDPPVDDKTKLTLTQAELDARVNTATEAAVKKANETAAAAAKKKSDEDAEKKAKEQGEFEKLYQGEVELRKKDISERDGTITSLRVEIAIGRYLAKNHKEYIDAAEWIRPHVKIAPDADDAAIEKEIKATVDKYVKDNPRDGKPPQSRQNIPSAARGGKVTTGGGRQTVPDDAADPKPQGKWDHLDQQH